MRTYSLLATLLFAGACATEGLQTDELSRAGETDDGGDDDGDDGPIKSGSFSTQSDDGAFPTTGAFFTAQGRNGRSCATCHVPGDAWAFNPATAQAVFEATGGLDPLFSRLDADIPTLTDAQIDAMSVDERRGVFTQLLKGKFTRNISLPADTQTTKREFDLVAVSDPFGISRPVSAASPNGRMWFFRTSMPTANFISPTVSWDGANSQSTGTPAKPDLYAGLVRQIRGNITGAQEGNPATDAVVFEIADFELAMHVASTKIAGVGALDKHGAEAGPEAHAADTAIAGRFDLFDGWKNSGNPHRRAIYRGQELFNNGDANGRKCSGCHNAKNSGQNVNGTLFDVGVSRPEFATADMAVFTFQERSTGKLHVTTDPGRGGRSGRFADLSRFKTPTLRGLAARTVFFHNGIASSLAEVVDVYERALGFDFTEEQEADLVAFMTAL